MLNGMFQLMNPGGLQPLALQKGVSYPENNNVCVIWRRTVLTQREDGTEGRVSGLQAGEIGSPLDEWWK